MTLSAESTERRDSKKPPETSILMVVRSLAVTRLAVMRTFRHPANAESRLVVVDTASKDGTREWLRLLARRRSRPDRLLHNISHGPGLEVSRTRSPYLVTLDSDAFPLRDDWLTHLRARLDAGAAVTGILHHRDYIPPSCLMIARHTLDEFRLTFLDERNGQAGSTSRNESAWNCAGADC